MRFFFLGPRILGLRSGVSFAPGDIRRMMPPPLPPSGTGRNMTGGFVYVLADESGRHKIGSAIDPISRRATLQTGSADALSFAFIGVAPGSSYTAIEKAAHDLLDARRVSGGGSEWFAVPASIAIGAVYEVAQRNGWAVQQVTPEMVPQIIQAANAPAPSSGTERRPPSLASETVKWSVVAVLGALAMASLAVWLKP